LRRQKRIGKLSWAVGDRQIREMAWELLSVAASASVLAYGAWRALGGELTVGELAMFLGYVALLVGPMEQLSNTVTMVRRQAVAAAHLLDAEAAARGELRSEQVPKDAAAIRFEGVGFRYPGSERWALRDVNFELDPGLVVAIVGESGAGKSTLLRILLGCYEPSEGRILLDGIDVRRLEPVAYRRLFGYVDQEIVLFTGTVAENIALGRPEATPAEIARAASLAEADDFIRELPQGYSTPLGLGGVGLSGGQRQRLALARALLSDPRIVVLDEATNQLDPATEAEVRVNLEKASRGRTVVMISHRPELLMPADRVLVLEQGRLRSTSDPVATSTAWPRAGRAFVAAHAAGKRAAA
jgi:ATP-binding cassette subfamily B protein/subfamily B ATP-binding cassette protein MsbA